MSRDFCTKKKFRQRRNNKSNLLKDNKIDGQVTKRENRRVKTRLG